MKCSACQHATYFSGFQITSRSRLSRSLRRRSIRPRHGQDISPMPCHSLVFYIDEPGPSINVLDWGNLSVQSSDTETDIEVAIQLERPRPARITSATSGGITAGEDRISVLSRKLGATSEAVRECGADCASAEYSDTDDGT